MNLKEKILSQLARRPMDYIPASLEDTLYNPDSIITIAITTLYGGNGAICTHEIDPDTNRPRLSEYTFVIQQEEGV